MTKNSFWYRKFFWYKFLLPLTQTVITFTNRYHDSKPLNLPISTNTEPIQIFKISTPTISTTLNSMVQSDFTYLFILYARRNEQSFRGGDCNVSDLFTIRLLFNRNFGVTAPCYTCVCQLQRRTIARKSLGNCTPDVVA